MLELYERRALMRYCHRLCGARFLKPNNLHIDDFVEWAVRTGELRGVAPEALTHDQSPQSVEAVRRQLRAATRDLRMPRKRSGLQIRIDGLVQQLGLDHLDGEIIAAIARYSFVPEAAQLFDGFGCEVDALERPHNRKLFASALNISDAELRRKIMQGGVLQRFGLLELNAVEMLPHFLKNYLDREDDARSLADLVLGDSLNAELPWEDFEHLAQERDYLAQLVAGAHASGRTGVNILLYGAPGVGKTELCKTLAAHSNVPIYAIGERDEYGAEPTRHERICAINIARSLLPKPSSAALLVDEADDILAQPNPLFFGGSAKGYSRVYVHRLLERTTCPTFWVMNAIDAIDPAVLRRMTYAVEVRTPAIKSRARIWRRLLDAGGIECSEEQARQLGRDFRSAPAIANSAVESARITGGSLKDVRRVADSLTTAMHGGISPRRTARDAAIFDPAFVNASVDLEAITAAVCGAGGKPLSFCIHGASGTGKSAYLRHLAEESGLELLQIRASDVLSKYVGESEQKVAEIFRQAREDHSFLVIDEADALLSQRSGDRQSWENGLVSEMLTWMEEHPLPFGVTTNNVDQLDRASLRRFTFRIHFGYLRSEQLAHACRQLLDLCVAEARLAALDRATIADVLLTRRQADALGVATDRSQVLHLLRETMIQREGFRRPVGFAA
ncbi:AAA family ATPase [Algiphilus sp.]|uniref:AAA family ATPase n=1 Tax=Algiphilus sp. TaxID=1872431 RepID=UPI003BAB09FE